MQRSLDEWLLEFQALLFKGFFTEGDAATRFRAMEHSNIKLKAVLRAFMNDVQPPQGPITDAQKVKK